MKNDMAVSTEIWFYHLERVPVEQLLTELLSKTLEKGWRAQVRLLSDERVKYFNSYLWTFRPDSFLPHGTESDGLFKRQPILLTTAKENLNNADVLFLVDGIHGEDLMSYKRCVTLLDGHDEKALSRARDFYKKSKADGLNVIYWQQGANGKWQQKV